MSKAGISGNNLLEACACVVYEFDMRTNVISFLGIVKNVVYIFGMSIVM